MAGAILVLNWNGWADSYECLKSLTDIEARVVLVDNGSTDNSIEACRQAFPSVEILANGTNLGFAEGNNRGIRYALGTGADWVMLLNNDTIVDKDFLAPLVDAIQDQHGLAFACPRIMYADHPTEPWFEHGAIDWRRGLPYNAPAPRDGGTDTPIGSGCCVVASRETWEQVGLLDQRFFLYWEDVDWTLSVVRAGGRGVMVRQSKVLHKVSASQAHGPSLGDFYFARNGLLFIAKHAPRKWATLAHFIAWRARERARALRRREPAALKAAALEVAGWSAAAMRRFGPVSGLVLALARR